MILWTIQRPLACEQLQSSGVLQADPKLAEPDFSAAYSWMAGQMRRHLSWSPDGMAVPLWAWYQYDGVKKRRPDLRRSGHLLAGERGVRIEFELNDALVLLSDFDLWHYVLNYWYLGASEPDQEAFEALLEVRELTMYAREPLPDEELDKAIRKSWERIFDLAGHDRHSAEKCRLQATFWELELEAVRRVDWFTAR